MKYSLRSLMIVVTLICIYCGAYSAMLSPVVIVDEASLGMVVSGYREPDFRIGGVISRFVFAPAIWLDRQIRPEYWQPFSDFDKP